MRLVNSFTLLCLFPAAAMAGNPSSANPVLSPDMAERDYVLKQVEKSGDKGNEYEHYSRICNDRGICRLSPKPEGVVVYDTAFGRQTVVYPDRNR